MLIENIIHMLKTKISYFWIEKMLVKPLGVKTQNVKCWPLWPFLITSVVWLFHQEWHVFMNIWIIFVSLKPVCCERLNDYERFVHIWIWLRFSVTFCCLKVRKFNQQRLIRQLQWINEIINLRNKNKTPVNQMVNYFAFVLENVWR